jgi:membrane protease YdiL (CAAX protease family)
VTVSFPPPAPETVIAAKPPFTPPAESRFGWPAAVIGIVFFVIVLLGVPLLALLVPDANPGAAQFVVSALAYALIVVFVVVVSWRRGQRSLTKDFGLAFRWIDLPLGLGVGFLAKVLSIVFGLIAIAITGNLPESGNVDLGPDPLWAALFGILIGSLLAPFVEELFFRGLVLRGVRNSIVRRSGRQKLAIVLALLVSGGVFGVMHLQPQFDTTLLISLGLSTFAFGVLNGLVSLATGRLGAAIIAHVFFNGTSIALLLAFPELVGSE